MKNSKSTIQKRQDKIMNHLEDFETVDTLSLARQLDVSETTVRRDLDQMEARGLVERYFGGVRLVRRTSYPIDSTLPADGDDALKEALAREAASMITDKDVVFINSSSTAMRVIKYIRAQSVVIVTNNARMLTQPHESGLEIILTGGEVYGNKQSLIGEFALHTIAKIKATKCVIGVSGISVRGGITSEVLPETAINQMMLSRCSGNKIVITDASKIGRERNFSSGQITDVTHLVTEKSANPDEIARLRARGLTIKLIDNPSVSA